MLPLSELKEWLRIDSNDDDLTLNSLIPASSLIIKQSTGVTAVDIQTNNEAQELYRTVQKIIITDLYENRDGSGKINPVLISMYAQLQAFKTSTDVIL